MQWENATADGECAELPVFDELPVFAVPPVVAGLPPQAARGTRAAMAPAVRAAWMGMGVMPAIPTPGRVTSGLPAMLHGCHAGRRMMAGCGGWGGRTVR